MTKKELLKKLEGVPDYYEVRADVDYESYTFHLITDLTIRGVIIGHNCECVFLTCTD